MRAFAARLEVSSHISLGVVEHGRPGGSGGENDLGGARKLCGEPEAQ